MLPEVEQDPQDTIQLSDGQDLMSWDNMNSSFKLDDYIIQPLDWGNLSPLLNTVNITGTGGSGGASGLTTGIYNPTYSGTYSWNTLNATNNVNIHSGGIDLDANADITIGGRSMKKMLEGIEHRLSILVPDPKKLQRYEALQQAYEHYKTLEALCNEEQQQEDK
jgi:hypothetical protein